MAAIPTVTEQQRQELIVELDTRITELDADLKKLIVGEVELEQLNTVTKPTSVDEAIKRQEQVQQLKKALREGATILAGLQALRKHADPSPANQRELEDTIVDQYRRKHLPMYERSYVVEKIGDRASEPAAQLSRDISSKTVFGWHERFDTEWMLNDITAFTKQRLNEIVEQLASEQ